MGVFAAFMFQMHAEHCWGWGAAGLGQLWVLGVRSLVARAVVQGSGLEQRCAWWSCEEEHTQGEREQLAKN